MKKFKKTLIVMLCLSFVFGFSGIPFTDLGKPGQALALDPGTWDIKADTWVATDNLGRTLPSYQEVGPKKENKTVGIFYNLWHNDFMTNTIASDPGGPRNIHQIIDANAANVNNTLNFASTPTAGPWGGIEHYHYWGQPLFNYYDLEQDDYVIRKHAQLLTDIGVDTLVFDLTNFWGSGTDNSSTAYHYAAFLKLAQVFTQIRSEGGNTPQFSFIVTWNPAYAKKAIERLYTDIYSIGAFSPLWFQWEGKPLLIGDPSAITNPTHLNFFTYRTGHPELTGTTGYNQWGWLQNYPQAPSFSAYNSKEQVVAGVAQNWTSGGLAAFSSRNGSNQFTARGRSYKNGVEPLFTDPTDAGYKSEYGFNFQEGLDRAVAIDPNFLFITQWNEWIAARFQNPLGWDPGTTNPAPAGVFYDAFTAEFSRDIEPTREGGLGDSHYYQLAAAIRKYKGLDIPANSSAATTIAVDGSYSDWTSVQPEFRDDVSDLSNRSEIGINPATTYTNTTGRNDLKVLKVARDNTNIYFYAETVNPISSYTNTNWMRLFIKTSDTATNWKGYNYVLNRTGVNSTTTALERSTGGWAWTTVRANTSYRVSGNKLEVAIPRADLGLSDLTKPIDLQFKWHDNMQTQGDEFEFYTNGDAAPNNRFNYRFTETSQAAYTVPNLTVNNSSASITYSGMNLAGNQDAYLNQDTHYSNVTGHYAQFTFTGTAVQWIGGKNTGNGNADVYIDGVFDKTIDTYATSNRIQQILYERTGLSAGSHTIKVVVKGTKNAASSAYFVNVDAFKYTPVSTVINNNNGSISYSGFNYAGGQTGAISSDVHYSNVPGHYAQYTFTGTSVSLFGEKDSGNGSADVYIDGALAAYIDTYASSRKTQQTLYRVDGLSAGSHTIKIIVRNAKNPQSSNYFVNVDAFEYR